MENSVSRRSFLKGSAFMAAGIAGAASLQGQAFAETTDATPEWMPETWDYETDVLVIGYGGAGL